MAVKEVPLWQKYCLTVEEAAAYSHIGENTLRDRIATEDCGFTIKNGNRTLINRKKFEKYLDSINVV